MVFDVQFDNIEQEITVTGNSAVFNLKLNDMNGVTKNSITANGSIIKKTISAAAGKNVFGGISVRMDRIIPSPIINSVTGAATPFGAGNFYPSYPTYIYGENFTQDASVYWADRECQIIELSGNAISVVSPGPNWASEGRFKVSQKDGFALSNGTFSYFYILIPEFFYPS